MSVIPSKRWLWSPTVHTPCLQILFIHTRAWCVGCTVSTVAVIKIFQLRHNALQSIKVKFTLYGICGTICHRIEHLRSTEVCLKICKLWRKEMMVMCSRKVGITQKLLLLQLLSSAETGLPSPSPCSHWLWISQWILGFFQHGNNHSPHSDDDVKMLRTSTPPHTFEVCHSKTEFHLNNIYKS